VLSLLILAAVGGVLSAIGAAILVGFDHPRPTAWIALPSTALAIVLLPLLVPRWGAIGAAGTTLLCSWMGAAAFMIVALRRVGAIFPVGTLLRTALISVAGYGAAALINATITPRDWIRLVCAALLVCAVPLEFRLLGEFSAEERKRLRAALTRLDLLRGAASRR
jgi:O-antigen/teichoic acid export membrane protein